MAYTHAPTTWQASTKAAIQHEVNALNNTVDRKVLKDMTDALIEAISDEFEVIDQN